MLRGVQMKPCELRGALLTHSTQGCKFKCEGDGDGVFYEHAVFVGNGAANTPYPPRLLSQECSLRQRSLMDSQ